MKPYVVQSFKNDLGEVADVRLISPKIRGSKTVEVIGAVASITPEPDTVYQCDELTSLTVTSFPADGTFWIWFTSGETATVVTGIDNFTVKANKLYKLTVENGYATNDSWPTGGDS